MPGSTGMFLSLRETGEYYSYQFYSFIHDTSVCYMGIQEFMISD